VQFSSVDDQIFMSCRHMVSLTTAY